MKNLKKISFVGLSKFLTNVNGIKNDENIDNISAVVKYSVTLLLQFMP
jgi:hypothetical protein